MKQILLYSLIYYFGGYKLALAMIWSNLEIFGVNNKVTIDVMCHDGAYPKLHFSSN